MGNIAADPVLRRFRTDVAKEFGDRVQRVVLFGSRARGDERPDSDYDIAVFLKNFESLSQELDPLIEIATAILSDTGAVISPKPFSDESYSRETLLMGEIRREGIDL